MKLKTSLSVTGLIFGLALLNVPDPILNELGKGVLIISILGFFVLAQNHILLVDDTYDHEMDESELRQSENDQETHQKVA